MEPKSDLEGHCQLSRGIKTKVGSESWDGISKIKGGCCDIQAEEWNGLKEHSGDILENRKGGMHLSDN